jgi:alkylation response protein AidB-like acyl-CoA dehydrogenase
LLDEQEVQMAVADMLADLAAERALVWQQAASFVPRQSGAAMAKFHASDTAVRVCERAMSLLAEYAVLHGPVEKGFRDARLTQIYEGTNQINRLAMIEDLHDELFPREGDA